MPLITGMARVYVNFGRWVADCPMDCGCALALEAKQMLFPCPECKVISEVDWPDNADEIWAALEKRPAPKTRNWYPAGHDLAVRFNIPHGQTVKELDDETYDHIGQRP